MEKSSLDLIKEYREIVDIHESEEHMAPGDKVKIVGFLKSLQLPRSKHVGQIGTIVKRHSGRWNNRAQQYGAGTWFDVKFDDGTTELLKITQLKFVSSPAEDQEKELEALRKKLNVKSVKFNTCDECDGEGCDYCEGTGKYAVGINSDHYL